MVCGSETLVPLNPMAGPTRLKKALNPRRALAEDRHDTSTTHSMKRPYSPRPSGASFASF